jgi:hypothetical protein
MNLDTDILLPVHGMTAPGSRSRTSLTTDLMRCSSRSNRERSAACGIACRHSLQRCLAFFEAASFRDRITVKVGLEMAGHLDGDSGYVSGYLMRRPTVARAHRSRVSRVHSRQEMFSLTTPLDGH